MAKSAIPIPQSKSKSLAIAARLREFHDRIDALEDEIGAIKEESLLLIYGKGLPAHGGVATLAEHTCLKHTAEMARDALYTLRILFFAHAHSFEMQAQSSLRASTTWESEAEDSRIQ